MKLSHQQDPTGFTFIELMLVVVLLGILALLAVPRYIDLSEAAKTTVLISDVSTMERIIHFYSWTRDTPPDTNPSNPGGMTDAQWNQYAAGHLGDFIAGDWPTRTPWGGYYAYRAYPANWSLINNWRRIGDSQQISQVVGDGPFEIIMIRFVNPADEAGFNKALDALSNSKYWNRVYRYSNEFNIGIPVIYE